MTKLLLCIAAISAAALVLLAVRPALDIHVAAVFYTGSHHFVGNTPLGVVMRYTVWAFPFVLYVVLLIAWLLVRLGALEARWAPRGRSLVFLTVSLAFGPGLLVHAVFKEASHRPRPYSVAQFGGTEPFRPFTRFDGPCQHSCSFPSAETAAATWVLAPASLLPAPWQIWALASTILYAAATGLLRMAFGGHFLSDVCCGALTTIVVILACRAWLVGEGRSGRTDRRDGAPFAEVHKNLP